MKHEEKQSLLQDLSARLPYGVIVELDEKFGFNKGTHTLVKELLDLYCVEGIKPYLRPMTSMTEEEKKEMLAIFERPCENPKLEVDEYCDITYTKYAESHRVIDMYYDAEQQAEWLDWLNAHHFDYRGLIERGLAIAVTKENNLY